MPKKPSRIQTDQIARFRLRRNHLAKESPADLVTICRDMCGVQAQVMSAAYLQVWARNHAVTRPEIETALWKTRTLVKTSLMRQTLHLVPTDELPVYLSAVKPNRVAGALRIMAKFGIEREEADALTLLIMEALSDRPLGRAGIRAAIHTKVSKRVRSYMEKVWSIVRIPVAEGMICYGSGEDNEVNFIRMDRWLPKMKLNSLSTLEAQTALFRKYLSTYGPATPADFAHWAGVAMADAKSLPALLAPELVELPGERKNCFLLRADLAALRKAGGATLPVRLLPHFDPYLLAHRDKEHLLSTKHYKRVYRNQGWISPVVLIDGAVAGVWSYKIKGKKLNVTIEAFGKLGQGARDEITREAKALTGFYGGTVECQFA